MCITPNFIWVQQGPKWEKQPVACRKCWRCKKNRVNDYTARALAEAATSKATLALTLTYAPRDDLADKLLHPRHFQLFMKMLRRSGHKVRYLVAGEYGDLRGRTHFHVLLFFSHIAPKRASTVPAYRPEHLLSPEQSRPLSAQLPQQQNSHIREWPHGHVFADWSADERAIRYVCKYLLSEDKNRAWFSLSKKPALGAAWFAQKAAIAKGLGVLPSSFNYLPPGGSKDRPYMMTGASRRDYLNAITQDPADKPRMSEYVLATFEKHERARLMDELENQPPEILDQLRDERRERDEQQARIMRLGHQAREADRLASLMLDSPSGVLRRRDGEWQGTHNG